MKKALPIVVLVTLLLLAGITWFMAYHAWKDSRTSAQRQTEDNVFANAKIKRVRLQGQPWWKYVNVKYKTKNGDASAVVLRLIEHYRKSTKKHEDILATSVAHGSTDPAYLLVLYAFNAAVEEGMIEPRFQEQTV